MSVNEDLIASGLRVLREPLSLFVCQGIEKEYGESWWADGVLETLVSERTPTTDDVRRYRKLPESGNVEDCAAAFDISICLTLLTKHWYRIFGPLLGKDHRGWAFELIGVRNQNKHLAGGDHASDFAWRALDTMYRLVESIDVQAATQLLALRSSVDLAVYGPAPVAQLAPRVLTEGSQPTPDVEARPALDRSAGEDLEDPFAAVGPDFSGNDLRGINFQGANLAGADFTGADLRNANLSNANLAGAIFGNTRLTDGDANPVILKGAQLDGATLNFKGTSLRYVNLSGLNLQGADFTETDLRNANLSNANLAGAIFGNTCLGDSNGNRAILVGASLDGTVLNFTNSVLRFADLSGLNLEGADFTGADLRNTNLSGAILRGVNLKNARLADALTTDVLWT